MEFYVPNRYYVQQWLAYENGAIIMSQNDGQTLRAFPAWTLAKVTGSLTIAFTQIDIIGNNEIALRKRLRRLQPRPDLH